MSDCTAPLLSPLVEDIAAICHIGFKNPSELRRLSISHNTPSNIDYPLNHSFQLFYTTDPPSSQKKRMKARRVARPSEAISKRSTPRIHLKLEPLAST